MKHDISIEGYVYRLRPVALGDAQFIVDLRTDDKLGRFLNPTSGEKSDQEEYISKYFNRPGDYYFIVERSETETLEGLVAIYDIDEKHKIAEWGRWIIRKGSMAAVESTLLIYRVAFEVLGLETVYCRTVIANESAVSFQDATGASRYRILRDYAKLGNGDYDSVEHRVRKEEWPAVKSNLNDKAIKLSRLLSAR